MSKLATINRKLYPQHLFHGPQWLVLGVNNICNLHCKMCDVGTQQLDTNFAVNLVGTHPLHMPLELFQRIADQTKKYYPNTKLGYAFTEPLVYKHLEESLAYANKLGLYTAITTNALNLRQKADMLVNGGLNQLYISLDGPEDIHNEIRGHKSSHQRALEGIETILSKKDIPISIFCVITEWNIGHLSRFLEELKRFPLKQVGFMHSNFITQANADAHNQLFGEHYKATTSNIDGIDFSAYDFDLLEQELATISQANHPFPVTVHPPVFSKTELEHYYLHPEQKVGKTCLDAFNNIMIKSDGSVIPAHGRCYNLNIGNLYEQELNQIWNSKAIGELRKALTKNGGLLPACTRCCSAVG
jgi:Fe-coproporphyrin III synthase